MCQYSGMPFYRKVNGPGTDETCKILEEWFLDYGYPRRLRSDGGPAFRIKFGEWCVKHHIIWEPASSYNPQSNGLAEAAVSRVKKVIKKAIYGNEDIKKALAEYKNYKMAGQSSPSEMFFGRKLRGQLPNLHMDVDMKQAELKREAVRTKFLDRDAGRKPSKQLKVHEKVWIQDDKTKLWNIPGVIESIRNKGRSYHIVGDNGSCMLRNSDI